MSIALWTTLAIAGGTVYPGDGPPIENGTVLIDGDHIVSVSPSSASVKADTVIDAHGKVVTPGLIDGMTGLGLVEIWAVDASRDVDSGVDHPIRAAHRAIDSFNPHSVVIPIQRAHGITTVVSAPSGGLIAGQAGAFDLRADLSLPVVARAPVAMMVRLGGIEKRSRGEVMTRLREVLDDTRQFAANRRAFERNQFRRTSASRLDLQALIPVVEGKLPLAVHIHRRSDIAALLQLAAEERVRLILVGATEAWQLADTIAAAKVPVVLDPTANLPVSFDAAHVRDDALVVLHRAGVKVVLSTFSAHQVRKLRQWAGNAVREGLPYEAALNAITAAPAQIYGLSDRGQLTAGRLANVVIWSGDPFEVSTRAERVIIRGQSVDLRHRQQALFECYRALPPCPQRQPVNPGKGETHPPATGVEQPQ